MAFSFFLVRGERAASIFKRRRVSKVKTKEIDIKTDPMSGNEYCAGEFFKYVNILLWVLVEEVCELSLGTPFILKSWRSIETTNGSNTFRLVSSL